MVRFSLICITYVQPYLISELNFFTGIVTGSILVVPIGWFKRKYFASPPYIYSGMPQTLIYLYIFFLVDRSAFSNFNFFRCEMNNQNPDKSVTTSNIRKLLPDVLPNDLPPYVTHKIVKKRMHFLRTEFEWLLDDIRRGSRDEAEVKILRLHCRRSIRISPSHF